MLLVFFTWHNFYNRQWTKDDSLAYPQPPVVGRVEHERVLAVYGSAFFRTRLLGQNTEGYLSGNALPSGAMTQIVHRAFGRETALTVDNFDDNNGIGLNSLGLPNTQTGGINANEFRFDRPPGPPAFNSSFYGLTTGMVANPNKSGGTIRRASQRPRGHNKHRGGCACADGTDGWPVAGEPRVRLLGV